MSAVAANASSLPVAPTRVSPLPLLLVLALQLALGFFLATQVPLVDPDEGRNAEIAREMAVNGDLVVPHLLGMPYLDKPPALFWGAALSIKVFGPTRWAPRLPAILAAFLVLTSVASLALRLDAPGVAWRAAALLAVAPLFVAIGAYVIFDMPLTLMVTWLWTLLARELMEGATARRRLGMFAAVILGVLLKGPVMLAWAVGGSFAVAILMRSREPMRWLGWGPGWLLVLAIAGGWFALASARFPEYPRYAFFEESIERLTQPTFDRNQPLWFALAVLVGGAFPWSLATPWRGLWMPTGRRGPADTLPRLALASRVATGFVLFALVFFTLSRSKLVTYLLPALPALAFLAGSAWSRYVGGARGERRESSARARRLAFAAVLAAFPLALAIGWRPLIAAATRESSEPLAHAIAAQGAPGALRVRYERCYSAGADYLLNRRSVVVSTHRDQTTSVYQARYRESLRARSLWTIRDDAEGLAPADVLVRPVPDDVALPAGATAFYRSRRFTAYRLTH